MSLDEYVTAALQARRESWTGEPSSQRSDQGVYRLPVCPCRAEDYAERRVYSLSMKNGKEGGRMFVFSTVIRSSLFIGKTELMNRFIMMFYLIFPPVHLNVSV